MTNSRGNIVRGLRSEDFRVFDNGIEKPIGGLLDPGQTVGLVLLIECGPSVLFLAKNEFNAANAALTAISPADRVAIVCFSNRPQLILGFTADKDEVRRSLRSLNFMAGFGQSNLSSCIIATVDWLASVPGHNTIVLITTGIDTSTPENWQVINQKLKTSSIRVLGISAIGDFRDPAKGKKQSSMDNPDRTFLNQILVQADQSLANVSEATGGEAYFPKNAQDPIVHVLKSLNSFAMNTFLNSPPRSMVGFTPSKSE